MTTIVGLDLGVTSATHVAVADGASVTRTLKAATTPTGLVEAIRKATGDEECHLVLESTAMSWFIAGVAAKKSGVPHTLYRVSGRKAAALRSFYQAYTKTDRIDARVLARMPLVDDSLRSFTLPSAPEMALRRLVKQRHTVMKERTRVKGRLRSTFHWTVPGLLGKGGVTEGFVKLLKRWPDLRQLSRARNTSLISESGMSLKEVEWFRHRLREAVAFYENHLDFESLALELGLAVEQHELLTSQLKRIEKRIASLHEQAFPADPLTTLPGIGPVVASTVRAFVGDGREFSNLAAFRAYTGLVPRENSSGESKRQGRISKAGPNLLRWSLYLAADSARRKDAELADLYRRLMEERGRHHHQAVCAVASHLAARIWATIRNNKPYEYRDLNGKPIDSVEASRLAQSLAVDATVRARLRNQRTRGRDGSQTRQPKAPQNHVQPSTTKIAELALDLAGRT